MKPYYDVIIVGAGPAGSIAARTAAEKGLSVLMLEKDRDVGYPVRCGEAVSRKGIEEFVPSDPNWIAAEIESFALIAPNGMEARLNYGESILVLERRIFDYHLASNAADAGAMVLTRSYVNGLIIENGVVCGVTYQRAGSQHSVRCKTVIAADGVESRVGRWAGIRTHSSFRDMESAVQVTASNIKIDQDTLYFYFGREVAPEGYLWVFPKGGNRANIGLGVSGTIGKKKSALSYLNDFMKSHFPDAAILTQVAGGVPCDLTLPQISGPGILIAGDAARHVNPLSGGGIVSGMIAGKVAAEITAEAIQSDNLTHLLDYDKAWHNRLGKRHEIYNKLKEGIYDFSDDIFNSLALTVNKIPMEKRTLGKIFAHAFVNRPSLILEAAKIFTSLY